MAGEKETPGNPMKTRPLLLPLLATALAALLPATAGNLNIINLTPHAPLELLLSHPSTQHSLAVQTHSSSRPFKLEATPATLTPTAEGLPALIIPSSEDPRLAILFPQKDTAAWKLIPSEPSRNAWTLRLINLTGETIPFTHLGEPAEIAKGKTLKLETRHQKDIALTLPGGETTTYPYGEPCSVIAFLTETEGKITLTFIADL